MTDPIIPATIAAAALVGLIVVALAGLKAWHEWLELRRLELEGRRGGGEPQSSPTGARIELADLRERVRKLEAIAAGVEL